MKNILSGASLVISDNDKNQKILGINSLEQGKFPILAYKLNRNLKCQNFIKKIIFNAN